MDGIHIEGLPVEGIGFRGADDCRRDGLTQALVPYWSALKSWLHTTTPFIGLGSGGPSPVSSLGVLSRIRRCLAFTSLLVSRLGSH